MADLGGDTDRGQAVQFQHLESHGRQFSGRAAFTELVRGGERGGVGRAPQVANVAEEDSGINRQPDEGSQADEGQCDEHQCLAALGIRPELAAKESESVRHRCLA